MTIGEMEDIKRLIEWWENKLRMQLDYKNKRTIECNENWNVLKSKYLDKLPNEKWSDATRKTGLSVQEKTEQDRLMCWDDYLHGDVLKSIRSECCLIIDFIRDLKKLGGK